LQSSLDALNAQIAILDKTGRIIAANAAWRHVAEVIAGRGECYFVGANYVEECERARPHQQMIAAGLRRVLRGELDEFRVEYKSDFVEGGWFQMRGTRFGTADGVRIVIANEDITEVKVSEGALRWLTGRLLRMQDEERRRIARELHDSTAQNLLGAALGIGQALRLAPRLKPVAKAALQESCALIEQSQREIRTVAYLLHPPMLDELGLPAALRWFSGGFAKRTEIAVDLDIATNVDRMSSELEAALFRVAQESLTNVHRHSGSTKVRLGLRLSDPPGAAPSVVLEIEDNGRGMPADIDERPSSTRRSHDLQNMGIGLAGMRERLRQFGGWLDINSTARGTTVRVTVPLSGKEALTDDDLT
jgi:signal transduction histidine kinase